MGDDASRIDAIERLFVQLVALMQAQSFDNHLLARLEKAALVGAGEPSRAEIRRILIDARSATKGVV